MKSLVIDASVAIKWFVPEVHSIAASQIFSMNTQLLVPDLIFAEVGSILWKKVRLKELMPDDAAEILNDFKRLPFDTYENEHLIHTAWFIAIKHQCTVYDSLYVALANSEKAVFVTADRRLYNTLQTTALNKHLLWVEDIKNLRH